MFVEADVRLFQLLNSCLNTFSDSDMIVISVVIAILVVIVIVNCYLPHQIVLNCTADKRLMEMEI